jgi:hypothetical protein
LDIDDDVRAEHALNGHAFLRADEQFGTVQMRTKFHDVRLDLANLGQAEHLKTALLVRIGRRNDLQSGPDVQMIRVAENDLRAAFDQLARIHRLDAGLRADGHVNRCIHDAVRGGQFSSRALVLESVLSTSNIRQRIH